MTSVLARVLPGVVFRETMRGNYYLLASPTEERAIEFSLVVRAKKQVWEIAGTIDMEGFATKRPLEGTLGFKLFDERRLPYRFSFVSDAGERCELRGQKEWTALAPLDSMTVLPAGIYDDAGKEIGRATLRFDLRSDIGRFLKSFRVKYF